MCAELFGKNPSITNCTVSIVRNTSVDRKYICFSEGRDFKDPTSLNAFMYISAKLAPSFLACDCPKLVNIPKLQFPVHIFDEPCGIEILTLDLLMEVSSAH
jgi:hypothetical protein